MKNKVLDYTLFPIGSLNEEQEILVLDLIMLAEDYERLKKIIK